MVCKLNSLLMIKLIKIGMLLKLKKFLINIINNGIMFISLILKLVKEPLLLLNHMKKLISIVKNS
jgi:hypothetical protein